MRCVMFMWSWQWSAVIYAYCINCLTFAIGMLCEIWISHSSVYKDYCLLGCDMEQSVYTNISEEYFAANLAKKNIFQTTWYNVLEDL
jgi:hypothetical protein